MAKRITPERAISFTKLMVAISYCWPLPVTATKAEVIRFKILRTVFIISASFLALLLVYGIYADRHDPVAAVKYVCLTCAAIHIPVQTIMFASHYDELQLLIQEAETYIRDAVPWKREILQQYTDKCAKFYAGFMLWFYFNATFLSLGPAVLPSQKFPIDAKYPFTLDFLPLKVAVYAHQSMVLYQCAGQVSVNGFIALLLWFLAARFEIMSREMQNVTDISQLYACIENHQFLLRYTETIVEIVRFLSLTGVVTSFTSIVFNGLILLVPTTLEAKVQFGLLTGTALLEIFMLSWPADQLMHVSSYVAEGIYGSKWYESSIDVQKTIVCIVMRSHKPITVSVGCVLPPMSLNYFASYLSTAFSYFTALRVMIDDAS